MIDMDAKVAKYKKLAVKKPKYYVAIGDLYLDEADFKTATTYYQKAVDNGVLAYTVLGDTWGYRSQYKKAFDAYTEGANKGEAECFARLGFCYENGYVKIDIQKAIECYAKASDLGVAAAARSLGELYYFNTPIEDSEIENVKNALKYYERAFYLGDIEVAKKNRLHILKQRGTERRSQSHRVVRKRIEPWRSLSQF